MLVHDFPGAAHGFVGPQSGGVQDNPVGAVFDLLDFFDLTLDHIFLWMMPSPPSWARAMAISFSVTVSIGELRMGIFSLIRRVNRVETSTSAGTTSL